MIKIKLEPNLSHCIETVAKREYKRVLDLLLKGKQENESELAGELEVLKLFLESADFGRLRCRCDEFLLDGRRMEVIVRSTAKTSGYEIEMNEVTDTTPI